MFNAVSFVRQLCKERGIPIATVEKDCGFGNGYLNPKKITTLSYERAVVLANYLNVTPEYLLTGEVPENKKPAPEIGNELEVLDKIIDNMSKEELLDFIAKATEALRDK